jgi:hypothetical protein
MQQLKSEAKPLPKLDDVRIIPLQDLYLTAIVAVCNADKLDCVQQQLGPEAGRLWLVRGGSTVPVASLTYKFTDDTVILGVQTRNERKRSWVVKYAEGIDEVLEEFSKFMREGLLAKPKAV